MKTIGIQALITILSQVIFIYIAFKAISAVHLERYMPRAPRQASLLIVMLAIVIGYTCANFFLNFFDNVRSLMLILN